MHLEGRQYKIIENPYLSLNPNLEQVSNTRKTQYQFSLLNNGDNPHIPDICGKN